MSSEHNPFAPPQAESQPLEFTAAVDSEAEEIRRRFLNHESIVWAIGWLYLLGAILMFFGVFGMSVSLSQQEGLEDMPNGIDLRPFFIALLVVYAVLGVISLCIGYGLRLLNNAARIGGIVFGSLFLLLCAISLQVIPLVVQILFLYCLACAKGRYVCSAEYGEIIGLTPHIRRRRWILFVALVFVALAVVSFIALPLILMGIR